MQKRTLLIKKCLSYRILTYMVIYNYVIKEPWANDIWTIKYNYNVTFEFNLTIVVTFKRHVE